MYLLTALPLPLTLACFAFAVPSTSPPSSGFTMNLLRRSPSIRSTSEWGAWAKQQKTALETKYGFASRSVLASRASGMNLVTNQNADSSYCGSLAVGTPPVSFDVILDTGSSDLWIATGATGSNIPNGIATFDPFSSSSYTPLDLPFSVNYGSGAASGVLGSDNVQMAGFEVQGQVFGVVTQTTAGMLTAPVSGLLGLGFQAISASGAMPFWETLSGAGVMDEPVMAFWLTRFVDSANGGDSDDGGGRGVMNRLNGTLSSSSSGHRKRDGGRVKALEPGGMFSVGATNRSLYEGNVEWVDIPRGEVGYWMLELASLTVQSTALSLPSGAGAYAAIDTGTTLVGGPPDAIAALYAQIPGSAPGTGEYMGYYTYPCLTVVNITLQFGNTSNTQWTVSDDDFRLAQLSANTCLGAFFELSSSSTPPVSTKRGVLGKGGAGPQWIVGDTFLKNVYTVFRYSPPSVGFARLSAAALAVNGDVNGAVPTPTLGTTAALVRSTSDGSELALNGARAGARIGETWWSGGLLMGAICAIWL